MNRIAKLLVSLVASAIILIGCSGGGGGGSSAGGGGGSLQPPAYNATGTWTVTETNNTNNCPSTPPLETFNVAVDHPSGSNSLTVTHLDTNRSYDGTISGSNITYSGPGTNTNCPNGFSLSVDMTLSSQNAFSGHSDWLCNYGSGTCSGTTTLSGVRQAGSALPSAPSNLVASASSLNASISLFWTDNSDNEIGFSIERSLSSSSGFSQIATVGANVTTYDDSGLIPFTTYYYRVRAFNGAGSSAYSNTDDATPAPALQPPAPPSGLTATVASSTSIQLTWSDISNNEDGFSIERSLSSSSGFSQIATVGGNTTSYTSTGLNPATTYYYRVRAFNGVGNSAYSNTDDAITYPCTPGETRCVVGNIEAVQTCTNLGNGSVTWLQSTCSNWHLCSNSACRVICGITVGTPLYPTLCIVPNADGVNNGEWITWYNNNLTVPTYVNGGTSVNGNPNVHAPITSSGLTWPYKWRLTPQDIVYVQFRLDQFGQYRSPRLDFYAKRANVITNVTNRYRINVVSSGLVIATSHLAASTSWGSGTISITSPVNGQLDYAGDWNMMQLSITDSGSGGPIDDLDVNYMKLTIEP
jgi:hypothetical protein